MNSTTGSGYVAAESVRYLDYAHILDHHGILYTLTDPWLWTGKPDAGNKWVLFISVIPNDCLAMLNRVLPLLKEQNIPFKLIRDQKWHYRLNGGGFPLHSVGKCLTIFTEAFDQAVRLVACINEVTADLRGQQVPDAAQVGEIVFATFYDKVDNGNGTNTLLARRYGPKDFPFPVPHQYRPAKRKKFIGKRFLPVKVIRPGYKGAIFRAVNFKRFPFQWCIVKQGKANAASDEYNRSIADRLQWQKDVLKDVAGIVNAPRFVDYFKDGKDTYLAMEEVQGISLTEKVTSRLMNRSWQELTVAEQTELLNIYDDILLQISTLHAKGYVHRDITPANFILSRNGVAVIDFELSYNTRSAHPFPPFILGTLGYTAPEQLKLAVPTEKEDVYSLGILLAFITTGMPAAELKINDDPASLLEKLAIRKVDKDLIDIVGHCTVQDPASRSGMTYLRVAIASALKSRTAPR